MKKITAFTWHDITSVLDALQIASGQTYGKEKLALIVDAVQAGGITVRKAGKDIHISTLNQLQELIDTYDKHIKVLNYDFALIQKNMSQKQTTNTQIESDSGQNKITKNLFSWIRELFSKREKGVSTVESKVESTPAPTLSNARAGYLDFASLITKNDKQVHKDLLFYFNEKSDYFKKYEFDLAQRGIDSVAELPDVIALVDTLIRYNKVAYLDWKTELNYSLDRIDTLSDIRAFLSARASERRGHCLC